MSNINNNYTLEDYTIALDRNGKVLYCDTPTSLPAYFFTTDTREAETIIHGNRLSSNPTPYLKHANVRNIFTYDENKKNIISNYFKDGKNNSGELVTVSQINKYDDLGFKEITINGIDYLIKDNTIFASMFGVNGDGSDETDKINEAIAYVVANGGKLLFKGDATYIISSPIMVCSPTKDETNPTAEHDFYIDFNHCRITVADNLTSNKLLESMIYVNVDFTDTNKMGIVQNVQLYPGIYQDGNVYKPRANTGLYLASSSQISYNNIKIMDATRGVYIAEKYGEIYNENINIDNIHISKTRQGAISLLDRNCESEKTNDYKDSILVGIDCEAKNCKFSNIIVIDYLIGMRVLGENNIVYGAHIWNYYCPEQYKHSVGFINGKANEYIACVADHFHIGWLSGNAAEFKLINCHWLGTDIKPETERIGTIGYGFYIADSIKNTYNGSNITAVDCNMKGSDLSLDDCYLEFCNVRNNAINYTGAINNTFYAPIPEMEKYDPLKNNIVDCENNSEKNQYGKIKSTEVVIAGNMDRLDLFELTSNDIKNDNSLVYIDNIKRAKENETDNDEFGIIYGYNINKTISKNDSEVVISISVPENDASGWNGIRIPLKHLGYKKGDVGCISFNYKTPKEGENTQVKHILFSATSIKEYFSNEAIYSEELVGNTEGDDNWKSYHCWFKIDEGFTGSEYILIGYGELGAEIAKSTESIEIKNLRIVKNPNKFTVPKIPKYYLETDESYNKRLSKIYTYENSKIIYDEETGLATIKLREYNQSHPLYQKYGEDAELAFVSLPFKYSIRTLPLANSNNDNKYYMKYTSLGGVCFIKTNSELNTYCSAIEMSFDVKDKGKLFLKQDYDYIENNWDYYIYILNKNTNEYYIFNSKVNLRNFDITENNVKCSATMALPSCDEKDFLLKNLSCNPYGYHFESPVDAKYDDSNNNEPIEVDIPLYINGEVRLIMKNAVYNTDLPTVFYKINYSESQENGG